MNNCQSIHKRVKNCQSIEDLKKIEESLTRLWNNGAITEGEFYQMDYMVLDKYIQFEDL